MESKGGHGRVASYAWGDDYHVVIKEKLVALSAKMHDHIPFPFRTRACVDTAPLLEREYAAAAGVGWIGKNTMVIDPQVGSFFFFGCNYHDTRAIRGSTVGRSLRQLHCLPRGVSDRCVFQRRMRWTHRGVSVT